MRLIAAALPAAAGLAIGAVALGPWGAGPGPADARAATPQVEAQGASVAHRKPTHAKLTVIETRFGRMLGDRDGYALYAFSRDDRDETRCKGACAEDWPPFKTKRDPKAGKGLKDGRIGTTNRPNGSRQVTFRGHPLYYYVGDREPKQVFCQNVVEHGGRWLIVNGKGKPIR